MTREECDRFDLNIRQRVHERWQRNKSIYEAGYAVFYGPIHYQPDLMIVGANPGGGKKDFICDDPQKPREADRPMEYPFVSM